MYYLVNKQWADDHCTSSGSFSHFFQIFRHLTLKLITVMAPTKEMDKTAEKKSKKEKQPNIEESEESSVEDPPPKKKSSRPKKKKRSRKSSDGLGLIKSDPTTLPNLGNGVLDNQQQQQTQQQQPGGGGGGDHPLSLRLDLNLEVEITLKARVHGDVTLALLA
ncbi:hypothetical protein K501DRAFT_269901 [Backusella circina FSU 941]|nr:hypothetical protein K501DRAFT_269901 [Backusella circina FSU 941]